MEFTTRWLGERVPAADLRDGDLFIVEQRDRAYLALRVSTPHEQFAALLAIYGDADGDPLPRLLYAEVLVADNHAVRLIRGGELCFETLPERTPTLAFLSEVGAAIPNGSLAILDGNALAIRILSGGPPITFDVASGSAIPDLPAPRIWQTRWRLVWRFGEDEMGILPNRLTE